MKALDLQTERLNFVSATLCDCLSGAKGRKDSIAEINIQNAIDNNKAVIAFITTMNKAFAEVEPDLCPNCGHDLADNRPVWGK